MFLIATAGCGIPPLRSSAAVAVAGGEDVSTATEAQLGTAVHAFGATPELHRRAVDVSVGAFAAYDKRDAIAPDKRWLVGPTTAVEGYPVRIDDGASLVRVVVGAEVRTLYSPGYDAWGPFLAHRLGIETIDYLNGCGASASSSGIGLACWEGEGGFGAFADVAVGSLEGKLRYSVGLGVEFRSPYALVFAIPFPK